MLPRWQSGGCWWWWGRCWPSRWWRWRWWHKTHGVRMQEAHVMGTRVMGSRMWLHPVMMRSSGIRMDGWTISCPSHRGRERVRSTMQSWKWPIGGHPGRTVQRRLTSCHVSWPWGSLNRIVGRSSCSSNRGRHWGFTQFCHEGKIFFIHPCFILGRLRFPRSHLNTCKLAVRGNMASTATLCAQGGIGNSTRFSTLPGP